MNAVVEEKSESLPIEISMGGKNKHTHWCEPLEQRRHYGACLHAIETLSGVEDSEGTIKEDCARQIGRGTCPAINMRKAEVSAGKALFYKSSSAVEVPKEYRADKSSPSYVRGFNQVPGSKVENLSPPKDKIAATTSVERVAPKPIKKDKKEEFESPDYANLVTDMAKKEGEVTVFAAGDKVGKTTISTDEQPATVDVNKPKKGESMLEMAKRLRRAKEE